MKKHKDAEQLMGEIEEIIKELKVYEGYRKAFLKSLGAVEADYKSKGLSYLQYESRLKLVLKGKTKKDWIEYYNAYEYSLLKKIEFILSQVFSIVYDDESYAKLSISEQPSAQAEHEKKGIEVFNIDNEIMRLKGLLRKSYTAQEVKAAVRQFDFKVPELEEIKAEIRKTEAAERAKEAAVKKTVALPSTKPEPVGNYKAPARLRVRIPRLNFSLKDGMMELTAGYSAFKRAAKAFLKKLHFTAKIKPAVREEAEGKPLPEKEKGLISFSDIAYASKGMEGKAAPKHKKSTSVLSALKAAVFSRKTKTFIEDVISMERISRKSSEKGNLASREAGIAFGWFSPKRFIMELTGRFQKKQEPILGKSTSVPSHMKRLREMRKRLYHEERLSSFDTTLLSQEAKRIKKILEVEKKEVYQGSSLGLIANVTVRKISLSLVSNFPQFFGYLYNALRAANVRVLSNTYVNIMVLVTITLTFGSFLFLLIVFFILNHPLYQILLRSFIFSIVAGLLCATMFYLYPFMKIRDRRRRTTTNLPFAINHMSAVSTSGVSPARMFELIAASGEYEEIGVELKKIVDFTNIFGYDLLTAIRAVAATTPSIAFKKFLEGMVSTIETGGDLVSYLRQQADEAALTYKLERQRYNETVSTYSDIYTGVLIAAPLFFIAAMALVNLLGGTLGGLGVGVIMALGAYIVIPLLNIAFIIFLQMTQPEV